MNLDKTILVSPSAPALAIDRQSTRIGVRAWVLTVFLFLVPLVAYWPATFHDYGLRDDYSNLREAHEEPGKVLKFCASHARPIYGLMLQASYGQTSSVLNLRWMRLLSALLLGTVALVSFRGLRSLGWSYNTSLCFAVAVTLVPSSQVIAGWAVGWPYAVAALISFGSFFIAESALASADAATHRSVAQWSVALGLMVVSALIYQPSALFYVVPLSAALIERRELGAVRAARWVGFHLAFVAASLGVAYGVMSALYAAGMFVKSGRIAFEQHWGEKLAWFIQEPLTNALSMLVLNDNNHLDRGLYLGCAAMVLLVLAGGAAAEWRRHGRARGLIWLAALLVLPACAFAACLVASERYATYRTILAMTAVILCFLIASLRALTEGLGAGRRMLVAVGACTVLYLTAQHHTYALLALPQGNEWQLIVDGAKQVRLADGRRPSIFAIKSSPADISTATIYHDEFGSLSSNSEWVPKEMFKRAMHDLHPEIPNLDARYDFATGPKLPGGRHFDVIIDLHRLRRFYSDN
jgi:hypothetical protein